MVNWLNTIVNLLPMLLLILLFPYFMRKSGWPRRYQEKQLELLEQQVLAIRQTNELLKKLVGAG